MASLAISLMGPVQVISDDHIVVDLAYDKVRALLFYLTVESNRPHTRDALASLFWQDQPDEVARHSLRQALLILRQAIGETSTRATGTAESAASFFLLTRATVQFNPTSEHWLDVAAFSSLLTACSQHPHRRAEVCISCAQRMEQAVALYRGNFLQHFFPRDCVGFEEWAAVVRERLHRQAVEALVWLADYYAWHGAYADVCRCARRLVELEPLNEDAHQRLMLGLALSGERHAAVAQYGSCRRILDQELGIEPSAETNALYKQIRIGALQGGPGATRYTPDRETSALMRTTLQPTLQHNLPPQPNRFIGRERELAELREVLTRSDCRLVTIMGPGGIGKSRLAIQAASEQIVAFAHGVYFVALAPVSCVDQIVSAIAAALALKFYGPDEPKEQLLAHLRQKEMLLLLDNFEHLLEGAELLGEILQRAPAITLLVTSRVALHLRWEWPYTIEGLCYPDQDQEQLVEQYSAVRLFLQQAGRVRPHFALSDSERAFVVRICRLAAGMPLAIELAASWVRALTLDEIAAQIAGDLDFLTASMEDMPERHRSIRAVFDHSWRLLSEEARAVFARLSVFRGDFRREAAEYVAGATPAILFSLVDTSFLHLTPAGRYIIHELLRQYGTTKLREATGATEQTRDRHSDYYAGYMHQRAKWLVSGRQKQAIAEIGAEIENVRSGWNWAVEQGLLRTIHHYFDALWRFYALRGPFQEATATFRSATERLAGILAAKSDDALRQRTLAVLKASQGLFCAQIGLGSTGRELMEEGLATLRRLGAWEDMMYPLSVLGYLLVQVGEYAQGNERLLEFLAICEELGDRWGKATALTNLGVVSYTMGEFTEAKPLLERGLVIYRANNDPRGMASALAYLGAVCSALEQYDEAERALQESLRISRDMDDRFAMVLALEHLGHAASQAGADMQAQRYFREAVKAGMEIRAIPWVLDVMAGFATTTARAGNRERALELLAFVLRHPACLEETKNRAGQLLAELESLLSAHVISLAWERGSMRTVEDVAPEILEISEASDSRRSREHNIEVAGMHPPSNVFTFVSRHTRSLT